MGWAMLTPRQLKKTVQTPDGHMLWTGALANGYPAGKHEGKTVTSSASSGGDQRPDPRRLRSHL